MRSRLRAIAQRLQRPIITIRLDSCTAPIVLADQRPLERGTLRIYGRATKLDRGLIVIHQVTRWTLDRQPLQARHIEIQQRSAHP